MGQSFSLSIPVHSYVCSPSLKSKVINPSVLEGLLCAGVPGLMSLWVLWMNVCQPHRDAAGSSPWGRAGLRGDRSPAPRNCRCGCTRWWALRDRVLTRSILLVENAVWYIRYNHNYSYQKIFFLYFSLCLFYILMALFFFFSSIFLGLLFTQFIKLFSLFRQNWETSHSTSGQV